MTLVAASKGVLSNSQFFSYLNLIITLVDSSCKRNDQLREAQFMKIAEMISMDELETGKGKNQIGNLKRPGDIRWSSHLKSIHSLIKMYDATCSVLQDVIIDGNCLTQRGQADGVYDVMTSFEFVFHITSLERYFRDYR